VDFLGREVYPDVAQRNREAQEGELLKPNRNVRLFLYLYFLFSAMHIVYILHSQKLNRFYIGYTTNPKTRFDFHCYDTQTQKFTFKASDWTLF